MTEKPNIIIRRASSLFIFAFVWAGSINILPQLYLLEMAPDQKNLLLSGVLLIGTFGAIIGNWLSRQQLNQQKRLSHRGLLIATLGYLIPFFVVIVEIHVVLVYFIAYFLFRLISNWLFNSLDHTLLQAITQSAGKQYYAKAAVGFQILGQMSGPMAFVFLAQTPGLTIGLMILLCGWATLAVIDAMSPNTMTTATNERQRPALSAIPKHGIVYLVYSLLILSGIIGLFAQFIYLLQDYIAITNPKETGGLLITFIGIVSIFTAIYTLRSEGAKQSRFTFLWSPLLLCLAIVGIAIKPSIIGLLIAAIFAGIGGGRFLFLSRLYASSWEGQPGMVNILSLYNNIPNYASLFIYVLTGGLAFFVGNTPHIYNPLLLLLFFILFCSAGWLCWLSPFFIFSKDEESV